MKEIEVGEYVRTKEGYIIKVEERTVIFNMGYKEQYIDLESTKYGLPYEEEIVKHSPNIIDLIEVGDYVNGHLVVEISENIQIKPLVVTEVDGKDGAVRHFYAEKSIKSIVTHEQFASMQYRLED